MFRIGPRMCPAHREESFFRGAGNRTRSTRTRSVRTTGILHPEKRTPHCTCTDTALYTPKFCIVAENRGGCILTLFDVWSRIVFC